VADTDPPILAYFGKWGDGMTGMLRVIAPDDTFITCGPDGTPPPAADGAEVLVTLASDVQGIERALAPGVRWVHVMGAGVDGFPFEVIGDRVLTCSRGASAPAISEFVLAVILAFEKQLPTTWITEPPEHWNLADLGGLRGKTVGIIGLGAIGSEVARRAVAFDTRVMALRRTNKPADLAGVEVVTSLHDLLRQSDHVVIAAPATGATRHMIDADALAAMKPGAHLVNIARGSLVDQDALVHALDSGTLAMASLDVVDPEPLPAGHALFAHPKVRVSPHVSWSSPDTMQRTFDLFVENLRRCRAGEPLQGIVDTAAGY
jgi:phosphoglycerate dehydrogenase-like enzyme